MALFVEHPPGVGHCARHLTLPALLGTFTAALPWQTRKLPLASVSYVLRVTELVPGRTWNQINVRFQREPCTFQGVEENTGNLEEGKFCGKWEQPQQALPRREMPAAGTGYVSLAHGRLAGALGCRLPGRGRCLGIITFKKLFFN